MNIKHLGKQLIGPIVGLFLFTAALYVLRRELHQYQFKTLLTNWRTLSYWKFSAALVITMVNYLIMTGYDFLALRFIRMPLPYRKIQAASFIGYAFSNNIGFSMIAGASVRFRLYSGWGLSAFDIAKVIGFCTITVWVGFLSLSGLVFVIRPVALPTGFYLPVASTFPVGLFLLGLVGAAYALTLLRTRPVTIRDWEIEIPGPRLFSLQIALSVVDWAIGAGILYVLLPASAGISYPEFIGIFLLAQLAGFASQIPGGLGVFETLMMLLLRPYVSPDELIISLLAYRAIYYLIPLVAATILLGAEEILAKRNLLGRFAEEFYNQWIAASVSTLMSYAVFMGGVILLLSSAIPPVPGRMQVLEKLLPLPVIELSHLAAGIAGLSLLLLARGLQLQIGAAYLLSVLTLMAGIAASLLKGLDYVEAILLAIILVALIPGWGQFSRKAPLRHLNVNAGWIATILIVLIGSVWLGLFTYKNVDYTNALWWDFSFGANAPRFMRTTVAVLILTVVISVLRFRRPAAPRPTFTETDDRSVIAPIVSSSPTTYANLALTGSARFMVNEAVSAFIMYAVQGRSWIAMGDPVGPMKEKIGLARHFSEASGQTDGWPVFYMADTACLPIYLDLGLSLVKLGHEARVRLSDFSLAGDAKKPLRESYESIKAMGYSFEVFPPEQTKDLLSILRPISDAWFESGPQRESRFSRGSSTPDDLTPFPIALVRSGDKPVAFANLWQGTGNEEMSIDLVRYLSEAPDGMLDFMLISAILWSRRMGYGWFSLGMTPAAGAQGKVLDPLWQRAGVSAVRLGEHFSSFSEVRHYKNRFSPVWFDKYLASPGSLALPPILVDLGDLISGISRRKRRR